MQDYRRIQTLAQAAFVAAISCAAMFFVATNVASAAPRVAMLVGTQYDTTHVYVAPDQIDALVSSFVATFGGHANPRAVTNVLPVPSTAESQAVLTPAGNLSVFAFQTPIPYPFGLERNGYLVADMDDAVKAAGAAGAEIVVAPFTDPIGRDAMIQWPGGVKMQLYWHFKAPSSAPLQTVPENRVYVSPDRADEFERDIVKFAHGKVTSDSAQADAGEIGRPGETYRRIRIGSDFGKIVVFVTDGHLPYPFGYDRTGYEVADLNAALDKAKSSGAEILSPIKDIGDRDSAIVEFPGGYIAEIHQLKP